MSPKRIIPCLDLKDGRVVKGTNFVGLHDAGDAVERGAFYAAQGADELTLLDITASTDNRDTLVGIIERIAARVFIPITVGGGVRSVDDVRRVLRSGADKVSLNTAAVARPQLIAEAATVFGSQCVVLAIDARRSGESWEVVTHGGRTGTGLDAIAWAQQGVDLGAGEILLTSIDRDGTKQGYDTALLAAIAAVVPVPLIASGGAGSLAHLAAAFTEGHADAALAAGIFHSGQHTIAEAKAYLAQHGIPIRPIVRSQS